MNRLAMNRTRLSLLYAATYLGFSGLGFTFFPKLALRFLFSTGHYELLFVRMSGLFLVGLSVLVVQSVRYGLSELYPSLIWIRVFFCIGYVIFYRQTSDPLFLVCLGVVALGLAMSSVSYGLDRAEM